MNGKQEMGTGSIKKWMVQLAVPALIAQVINLLYNIVDRVYIGHIPEIGGAALTGVGLFAPIVILMTAFAMLAGAGGAPRAAIAMGEQKMEQAEKILSNSFTVLMIFAALLTAGLSAAAPGMLRFFGASEQTLPYALEYGRIYIFGSVFVLIVMGMNVFITTQGFAKISMLTTVIGAVLNIILDPLLIFVFGMGVRGAALATVISQAVSAGWILYFLTGKQTILKLKRENLRLQKEIILPCLGLGFSTFVMMSTESLLSISFTSSLARYGGDLAVGAVTILTSVNQLIMMPISGLSQGAQPLISYNYGAKKYSRVREAFYCLFVVSIAYTGAFWLLVMTMPDALAGIFTADAALVRYTAKTMRVFLAAGFAMGFQMSCQQAFMALGQAKISLIMACLRKLILLIPLIFILPLFFTNAEGKTLAVYLAEPVSDFIAASVTTFMFFRFFHKMPKE